MVRLSVLGWRRSMLSDIGRQRPLTPALSSVVAGVVLPVLAAAAAPTLTAA